MDLPFYLFLDWDGWFDCLAHISTSKDLSFAIQTHDRLLTLLFRFRIMILRSIRKQFRTMYNIPSQKKDEGNGHGDGFLFTNKLLEGTLKNVDAVICVSHTG